MTGRSGLCLGTRVENGPVTAVNARNAWASAVNSRKGSPTTVLRYSTNPGCGTYDCRRCLQLLGKHCKEHGSGLRVCLRAEFSPKLSHSQGLPKEGIGKQTPSNIPAGV